MGFVDRNDELNALDEEYNARRSSFIVIYGRRRIGKTELIKRSIEKLPSAYYLATEGIFSAVKRKFGENLVSRKKESLINEAFQRFWVYHMLQSLRI